MKNSILITYKCNKLGEHDCLSTELNSIRVKIFADKMEAIHFIGECTSCDHNIKDVYPELFWWENDIDKDIEGSCTDLEAIINFSKFNQNH